MGHCFLGSALGRFTGLFSRREHAIIVTVHSLNPVQNPFSPSAELLGIDINPLDTIHHEGLVYTEVRGCDIWLVQGSEPNQFYVSNALGVRRSQIREDPTDAVLDLLDLDPTLLGRQVRSPRLFKNALVQHFLPPY